MMLGPFPKFAKMGLVYYQNYQNDIIFIGSATTCGFILQVVSKRYIHNQKQGRRVIKFIG